MSQLRGRFRKFDSTSCTVLRDEKRVRSQMSDCGRVAGVHDEAIGVQYARVCTLYTRMRSRRGAGSRMHG